MDIIIFGQLTDITGDNIELNNIADTNHLTEELNKTYPQLINAKYVIAVDKKVITENTILNNQSNIALLPPFSGG